MRMRRRSVLQLCMLLGAGYWLTRDSADQAQPSSTDFQFAVERGGGVGSAPAAGAMATATSSLRTENARLRNQNQRTQAAITQMTAQAELRRELPAEATAASAGGPPPRLVIAVNTIPRPADNVTGLEPDYLLQLLQSISKQVDSATEGKFVVYVLNLRPGDHALFATAHRMYHADRHFVFAETHPDMEDGAAAQQAEIDGLGGTADDAGDGTQGIPLPGLRNRQQTRDVARLTRLVHHRFARTPYTLLIEDDFVLCDGALTKLNGLVAPDNGIEMDWTAIRVSYGLCGVMLQRKDLLAFASYLLEMQFYRPVDILAYYWFARESSQRQPLALAHYGSGRTNFNYRHNLLKHIGAVSTYPGRPVRQFAGCGRDVLVVWSLHKHERFDLDSCPSYMLSPCPAVEPWPSQAAKEYLAALESPEALDQTQLEAISTEQVQPGLQDAGTNLTLSIGVNQLGSKIPGVEHGGVPTPPYLPTVFIATPDAVAGETIPHTAPWEQGKTLREGPEDDPTFAAEPRQAGDGL